MKNVEYIVYKITNKLNGKVYIGQTTEGIEKRWKRHCGYQINDGTYFHNAIKKYGAENFTIEIIDKAKNQEELQIPAHLTTHSAKSRSVFPDITERVSASADQ